MCRREHNKLPIQAFKAKLAHVEGKEGKFMIVYYYYYMTTTTTWWQACILDVLVPRYIRGWSHQFTEDGGRGGT